MVFNTTYIGTNNVVIGNGNLIGAFSAVYNNAIGCAVLIN
jgi:hypothetical protein